MIAAADFVDQAPEIFGSLFASSYVDIDPKGTIVLECGHVLLVRDLLGIAAGDVALVMW